MIPWRPLVVESKVIKLFSCEGGALGECRSGIPKKPKPRRSAWICVNQLFQEALNRAVD